MKLEEVVKPGTRLIYSVKSDQGDYDFIVTIRDLKGTSFDWEMTAPASIKGTIKHTPKALAGAFKMYNFFQAETKTLDDATLSVWISQKLFNEFAKGKDAMKVCMNNPNDEPALMKQVVDGDLTVKVDGNATIIHDRFVKPARKAKDKWIIDPTIDDYFTYYNSAAFPIICRMHTNFTLTLKEVKTLNPSR